MAVVIGQVISRADNGDIKSIHMDSLANASVKDRILCLGVRSNEDKKISLINAGDTRVHKVLRAEIGIELSLIAPHIDIITVEAVEEVFKSDDAFNILELANNALDLLSWNTGELFSCNCHSLLPIQFCIGAIRLTRHGYGQSLLFQAIEGMPRLI